MKHDLTKPQTKGARRVLSAFTGALTELLSAHPFEEITASELCGLAGYPRATFYNYFDDKYDLLNFYWQIISRAVVNEESASLTVGEALNVYFDRLCDLLEKNEPQLHKILEHNLWDGYFFASCRIYLSGEIRRILDRVCAEGDCPVPGDIMANHCANTLLLVLGFRFNRGSRMSKAEAKTCIEYLLGGLLPDTGAII